MIFDKYGIERNLAVNDDSLLPFEIDQSNENIIYIRYWDLAKTAVHRITTNNGVVRREVAFGLWDNRENLDYQCVNNMIEV